MKLTELLHSINKEKEEGLINVDDWRWPDVDHLIAMGFDFSDDFHFKTTREPEITIYRKKEKESESDDEPSDFFYIEEKNKKLKRFKTFNDVIDYFDSYSQPELDKNK